MRRGNIAYVFRNRLVNAVVCFGLAGLIASCGGSGGGGDSDPLPLVPPPLPPVTIAGLISGFCKDQIDGIGEDSVLGELWKAASIPQSVGRVAPGATDVPSGILVASTTTRADGFYRFDNVPANETYYLTFSKTKFIREAYFEVTVEADTEESLEPVRLIPSQFEFSLQRVVGTVTNAGTGMALLGATVRMRGGINNRGGTVLQAVTTNSNGAYEMVDVETGNYTLEASREGFQTVYFDTLVLDENPASATDNQTVVESVALVPDALAGTTATVSGSIYAAYELVIGEFGIVDVSPPVLLGGAVVRLREGINTTVGTVIAEGFSDASGAYSLTSVPAGQYTLESSLVGFNAGFKNIAIATDTVDQNITLTPDVSILPDGAQRITAVLTWGTDTDLDGRMFQFEPEASSSLRFLNDDIDGFGPETSLLDVTDSNARYEYFVEDWTENPISASKAQVRVYRGNNLIYTFDLPLDDPDDAANPLDWWVFSIDRNMIEPVNDLGPLVSIDDADAVEGGELVFDVSLSFASRRDIVLDLAAEEGTATSDDFSPFIEFSTNVGLTWVSADGPSSTQVTIPAGSTLILVRIMANRDLDPENDEFFTLRVSDVVSGSVGRFTDTGRGTIRAIVIF